MKKVLALMNPLRLKFGAKEPPANDQQSSMDEFYGEGGFNFLYSLEELGHYMVIIGYIWQLVRQPAILDVGCGEGRLADLLKPQDYRHYHGIDISPVAIQRALKKKKPGMSYCVADLQFWIPDRSYDLIIFCESLYYISQPRDIVQRYAPYLTKDGYIIISVYRLFDQERVWDGMEQQFDLYGGDTVLNHQGIWDIRIFAPRINNNERGL